MDLNQTDIEDQGTGALDEAQTIPPEAVTPLDLSGDGVADGVLVQLSDALSFVALDMDGDAAADTASIDLDGDGAADVLVTEEDGGYRMTDTQGQNGEWVSREDLTRLAPQLVEALDLRFGDGVVPADSVEGDGILEGGTVPVWVEDGRLLGDPEGDSQYWFQQAQNGFCLPASIAQIVSEYTGQAYLDESAFVELANEQGAFVVGMDGVPGIPFERGVAILNEAGVPAEYTVGDLEELGVRLEQGYGIIAFIDSGELWTGEKAEDQAPDHAVVVTGIDLERGTVLLSDPGTPGGNVAEVPIELFQNAWADSEFAMIVCDQPPGEHVPADQLETTPGEGTQTAVPAAGAAAARADSGALPDLAEAGHLGGTEPGPLEAVTQWATQHPWILLPVVFAASRLIGR